MTSCQLSDRQKECLRLHRNDMTYGEIADSLGIGYETVATHIRRARERIRDAEQLVAEFSSPQENDGDAS